MFQQVDKDNGIVHLNTLSEKLEKLKKTLDILGSNRWNYVISTSEKLKPLMNHLEKLSNTQYKYEPTTFFFMDKERALDLEIP